MDATGLLVRLPTDSIAVRVAVASVVAVVLCRIVLRMGLRRPTVRVAMALLPGVALAAVLVAYASRPGMPGLWYAVDASGGLTIPVRDTYLSFAPVGLPLLVGVWAVVAAVRVGIRARRMHAARRALQELATTGGPAPDALVRTVERLAAALRVAPPLVVVVPSLSGGAAIAGIRRPTLLLDGPLVASLDAEELEGVLSHELAHVLRRDNLVALVLGVLRDTFFFVPGGRWSLQRLLREREHAADVTAVNLTRRPGALASGLLKVLEAATVRPADVACSPLLSNGMLLQRVEELCDERPLPGRARSSAEVAVVIGTLALAVSAAVIAPDAVAGAERERDALGVLLSDVAAPTGVAETGRSVVFTAYDRTTLSTGAAAPVSGPPQTSPLLLGLDDPELLDPTVLAACGSGLAACRDHGVDAMVPLTARPIVRVADGVVDQWRLDPVVRFGDQEYGVFWFQRRADAS